MITGIKLDIRTLPSGRRVLHFPYMTFSDTHLLTKYTRAKRLCNLLRHTSIDRLDMIGDIIDGEEMMNKEAWNVGPYHRQAIAEILRHAGEGRTINYYTGNHDEYLRGRKIIVDGKERDYRKLSGKTIAGIHILDQGEYRAPDGKKYLILHGDKYDSTLCKNGYSLGNALLSGLYELDHIIQENLSEKFSMAANIKWLTKSMISATTGTRRKMAKMLDESDYDALICGHTHIDEFFQTSGGKWIINDGCGIDRLKAFVHDGKNEAILDWGKHGLMVTYKDPSASWWKPLKTEYATWKEIGLPEGGIDIEPEENEYSIEVDRFLRLMRMQWPDRERQKLLADYKKQSDLVRSFENASQHNDNRSAEEQMRYQNECRILLQKREKLKLTRPERLILPADNVIPLKIPA
jgi:UDP-2,3-diacylglucosamine pyrophosphatase LpxH